METNNYGHANKLYIVSMVNLRQHRSYRDSMGLVVRVVVRFLEPIHSHKDIVKNKYSNQSNDN